MASSAHDRLAQLTTVAADKWDFLGCRAGLEGAKVIAAALGGACTARAVELWGNAVGPDGAAALARALEGNRTVRTLGLHGNNIGPRGARALAEALRTNTTLERLYLSANRIGDEGASALAAALPANRTLRVLSLRDNGIVAGGPVLLNAFVGNSRLVELDLSFNPVPAAVLTDLRSRSADRSVESTIADLLSRNAYDDAVSRDPTSAIVVALQIGHAPHVQALLRRRVAAAALAPALERALARGLESNVLAMAAAGPAELWVAADGFGDLLQRGQTLLSRGEWFHPKLGPAHAATFLVDVWRLQWAHALATLHPVAVRTLLRIPRPPLGAAPEAAAELQRKGRAVMRLLTAEDTAWGVEDEAAVLQHAHPEALAAVAVLHAAQRLAADPLFATGSPHATLWSTLRPLLTAIQGVFQKYATVGAPVAPAAYIRLAVTLRGLYAEVWQSRPGDRALNDAYGVACSLLAAAGYPTATPRRLADPRGGVRAERGTPRSRSQEHRSPRPDAPPPPQGRVPPSTRFT